ncbi:fatty acid desaturase family protein [Massilia sp. 2TAF26]|uniref:fatty acid desaturase family protein n=1 Tax=Massilia sp. 2TAF26 TaxID=3233012 RepID=UPI003F984611
MRLDWTQPLPREQIRPFLAKSDLAGWRMLAFNWGLIAACFGLVMWHPNPLTVALALIVLGGRQLGLGILMHETAHRSLFRTAALNEWVGQWLCAAPMFVELGIYRRYHFTHHQQAGTDGDPDLPNYEHYPVSPASLRRKLLRDLSGRSGLRAFAALMLLYASADQRSGYSYRAGAGEKRVLSARTLLRNSWRCALANALMLAACAAAGQAWTYLLWPVAWLTTYMLYSRIRNAAEHGALPGTREPDIWRNTRTVLASWWERLTVAPNYVNYHFEHHLVPAVPAWQLPRFHRWLREHGAYEAGAPLERGYVQVLRRMTGRGGFSPCADTATSRPPQ